MKKINEQRQIKESVTGDNWQATNMGFPSIEMLRHGPKCFYCQQRTTGGHSNDKNKKNHTFKPLQTHFKANEMFLANVVLWPEIVATKHWPSHLAKKQVHTQYIWKNQVTKWIENWMAMFEFYHLY